MSKALRTAAIVVGVAALAITTAGAGVAIASGVSLAAGTATVAGAVGLTAIGLSVSSLGLIAAGLSFAASVTAKKPKAAATTGNPEQFTADPNSFVPYWMGHFATAGVLAYRKTWDTADDGTNDRRSMVVILSLGPIAAITSFTADKLPVTFDGTGNASSPYANYMWQKTQLGATPEPTALTFGAGAGTPPTWDSARKLSGLAAAAWTVRFDTQGKKYTTGMPVPRWEGDGVMVYDPRRDSTYPGGSGGQRWNDESTWGYSDRPHLHALAFVIGRHQNGTRVFGVGAPIGQIDVGSFVEGANLDDLNDWKIGGIAYSGDEKWQTLKKILQAGMAEPLQLGAKISCFTNAPKVSLATITVADVVGAASVAATQPRRDRINGIVPRYWQAQNDWQFLPGTAVRVSSYEAADGGRRTKEVDYSFIPSDTSNSDKQIAVAARYDIENAREFGPITLPLKLRWIGYKPGDCVTALLPELGLANQPILLLNRDFDPTRGIPTFTARSETNAKHAFALGQTSVAPPTPSVSADATIPTPGPAAWAITATEISNFGSRVAALVIEGAVDSPVAEDVVFEYRPYASGAGPDDNWVSYGVVDPGTTKVVITSVQPNTAYEVGISYRRRGVAGVRLIIGPQTTPNVVALLPTSTWGPMIAYRAGSAVSYNGSSYLAVQDVPAGTPVTNATYWQLLSAAGAPGLSIAISPGALAIPCLSDGTPKSGALPVTAQIIFYDGSTDIHSSASYSLVATGCSASIDGNGLVTITALSADQASVVVTAAYGGKSMVQAISIAKVREGETPTAGYPAIPITGLGTFDFPYTVPLANGATVGAQGFIGFTVTGGNARIAMQLLYSVDNGGSYSVMPDGAPTDDQTATPSEPIQLSPVASYTNSSGAGQAVRIRVTVVKISGSGSQTASNNGYAEIS